MKNQKKLIINLQFQDLIIVQTKRFSYLTDYWATGNIKKLACHRCSKEKAFHEFHTSTKSSFGKGVDTQACKLCISEQGKEKRKAQSLVERKKYRQKNYRARLRTLVATSIKQKIHKKLKRYENGLGVGPVWRAIKKECGYNVDDLIAHIEKQFSPNMNWQNQTKPKKPGEYGWELDHIIPHSSFDYDSLSHPDFAKCWALKNLRPLSGIMNSQKGDKNLYKEILIIPNFERLNSPEQILEIILKNNENLRIKSNNEQPREILEQFAQKFERTKREPTLSTPIPLAPGSVNAIKRQLQIRNLFMNSSFRNETDQHATTTNFDYIIPSEINNVVSMEITSLDIPSNSWYHFNNLSFTYNTTDTVTLNGNYTATETVTKITAQLTDISISIDDNTQKITFTNDTASDVSITFSTDESSKKKSLGWLLGFRNMAYTIEGGGSIVSEGIIDTGANKYLYFCINDHQNNVNEMNSICVANNLSNKHILGKISIPSVSNQGNTTSFKSSYTSKRNYNGPVNLKRLHVQLLDKHGEIIDLNQMDFGFTLQLELLYERDLIV